MAGIRAFIAVEIDPQTKKNLSELILHLKKSNADVKWVTENQMHLTLKFLGNISHEKIHEVSNALDSIAGNLTAFHISLSKINAFPNINRPRVIWLGINKGAETLKLLNDKIEDELEKSGFSPLDSPGTEKERREFKAHLTLGRVRSSKNTLNLARLLKETAFSSEIDISISKLILFQSNLTLKGSVYSIILQKYLQNINGVTG